MRTIIECPYCRKPVTIVRKVAQGHEILENVHCSHCKRNMDIEFDAITNLPYFLAYFGKMEVPQPTEFNDFEELLKFVYVDYDEDEHMIGIRSKKSEDQKKQRAYEIRYHESSIDSLININYEEQQVKIVRCAQCGRYIHLNKEKDRKNVFGVFCNQCATRTKFRYSYEFLSEFYDAEQKQLKETGNQIESENQEEEKMTIKSTIIGFVLEDGGNYKIYNPDTNQLTKLSAEDFESLCLGEFPYRKVRANTLANREIVETMDGKIYYVSDASKNEMLDFETGKIERTAVASNLMVNSNCYIKYVPVLKKYSTFADVVAGKVDKRIAKMIEVVSDDIQSGRETTENNVVAKMVRFLMDPDYADILDTETLNDMVMADAQAFMVMNQMTSMQMAKSIMSTHGAIPLEIKKSEVVENEEVLTDETIKRPEEDDEAYKLRISKLMTEAAKNCDYEAAAKYQKLLKSLV